MNSRNRTVQFSPVETKKASQMVYEQLRSLILRGILQAGDALPPERKLMQQYRRSHPTIREALRMLEAAGLIQVLPGNAAVVCPLEDNPVEKPLDELFRYQAVTVLEVIEFMSAIAPDLASLAALRRDEKDLKQLFRELASISGPGEIYLHAVLPFHKSLTEACKNPLISAVWQALSRMVAEAGSDEGSAQEVLDEDTKSSHLLLLDAVQRQDERGAMQQARKSWKVWLNIPVHRHIAGKNDQKPTQAIGTEQPFSPVRTEKVSEAVYQQIRAKILGGELLPGDKLPPERELMELFGRSRPTIREALRMLESNHYVRTMPGSGTVVNTISTRAAERSMLDLIEMERIDPLDLKELRDICETVVVSWAAQRRSGDDLQRLSQILDNVESFVENIEESMDMGHRFNMLLARSVENKAAYMISRAVSEANYQLVRKAWKDQKQRITMADMIHHSHQIWQQHYRIFNAVSEQDPDRAREETRAHIKQANQPMD